MTFLLPRYCVTVLDNWTPMREFYFRFRAIRFAKKHPGYAYLFIRQGDRWVEA